MLIGFTFSTYEIKCPHVNIFICEMLHPCVIGFLNVLEFHMWSVWKTHLPLNPSRYLDMDNVLWLVFLPFLHVNHPENSMRLRKLYTWSVQNHIVSKCKGSANHMWDVQKAHFGVNVF